VTLFPTHYEEFDGGRYFDFSDNPNIDAWHDVENGDASTARYLPTMRCLASSGCWYRPQAPPLAAEGSVGFGENPCFYVRWNEEIPKHHTYIKHSENPIDTFTVAWIGYDNDG